MFNDRQIAFLIFSSSGLEMINLATVVSICRVLYLCYSRCVQVFELIIFGTADLLAFVKVVIYAKSQNEIFGDFRFSVFDFSICFKVNAEQAQQLTDKSPVRLMMFSLTFCCPIGTRPWPNPSPCTKPHVR